MRSEIIIRPIGDAESRQAIDLILPIQQQEFGVPVALEGQPDLLAIDLFYTKPGGGFWGALDGSKLVGSIGLISLGNGLGVIRKMFVHKTYRGKECGIAQRLLETLEDYCLSAGIGDLYLGTIDIMKAAMRFYERNGFSTIARSDLPVQFPIMPVDNTFYHLRLRP